MIANVSSGTFVLMRSAVKVINHKNVMGSILHRIILNRLYGKLFHMATRAMRFIPSINTKVTCDIKIHSNFWWNRFTTWQTHWYRHWTLVRFLSRTYSDILANRLAVDLKLASIDVSVVTMADPMMMKIKQPPIVKTLDKAKTATNTIETIPLSCS